MWFAMTGFQFFLQKTMPRKRHESSGMHQAALSVAEASMKASPARCNGLILTEEPGKNTLMGTKVEILEKWWYTGCIMYNQSPLQAIVLESGNMYLGCFGHFLVSIRCFL